MVVPDDLPLNTGRSLSDIVLEDRGPYWDRARPRDVILYLDTSAFVKLVIREERTDELRALFGEASLPSPVSSPTPKAVRPWDVGAERATCRRSSWNNGRPRSTSAGGGRWRCGSFRSCPETWRSSTAFAAWTPSSWPRPSDVRDVLLRARSAAPSFVFAAFDRRLLEAAEREGFATLGRPLA